MSKGLGKIQTIILRDLFDQIEFEQEEDEELKKTGRGKVKEPTEWLVECVTQDLYKEPPKYVHQVVCESVRRLEKRGWVKIIINPIKGKEKERYKRIHRLEGRKCPTRENLVEAEVKDWKIWNPKQNKFYDLSL